MGALLPEHLREPDEFQAAAPVRASRLPSEPMVRLRISMAEPMKQIHRFLDLQHRVPPLGEALPGNTGLNADDMRHLFEMLLLSFVGAFQDQPQKVVNDTVEHMGLDYDYFESQNGEIMLSMIDEISRVLTHHFPTQQKNSNRLYAGKELADKLEVFDAFLHGRDHVVIVLPQRVFNELQHAATQTPS